MAHIHCTNENCPDRPQCKKGEAMQDGQSNDYFTRYDDQHRCVEFECRHDRWRNYHSFGFRECDQCHIKQPYYSTLQHQR